MPDATIAFRGVAKSFGPIRALDRVDLDIARGTIHAIVGENGAGKSTLMNLLGGLATPDAGEITLDGATASFASPAVAIDAGIGMVSQHFHLAGPLGVADNLLIGQPDSLRAGRRKLAAALERLRRDYGFEVPAAVRVDTLSVALQQRLEIAKALIRLPRILILDEPTALLGAEETRALFALLRRLRQGGCTILFITHRLNEVHALADMVTVMRGGRVALTLPVHGADDAALAVAMIGRAPEPRRARARRGGGDILLAARGLAGSGLGPLDLDLRAGEIVGVAGVAGNGQSELVAALTGLAPARGELTWRGLPLPRAGRARQLRRLGLAHVPEDRMRLGIWARAAAWRNLLIGHQCRDRRRLLMRVGPLRKEAGRRMAEWEVRPPDPVIPAGALSGGNQQKLVSARELSGAPPVAIVAHPSRGVDLGTAELILSRLQALADAGSAILLVSYELSELRALADRIIVLAGGRVAGELRREDASPERLGRLMAGLERA